MTNLIGKPARRVKPRGTQRKRNYISVKVAQVKPVILPDGNALNIPESIIYYALEKLKEPFQAQVRIGKSKFGSGLIDFLLPRIDIALEYQGPFHDTAEGKARDIYRLFTREKLDLQVVYLYEYHLEDIHRVLARIIGQGQKNGLAGRERTIAEDIGL